MKSDKLVLGGAQFGMSYGVTNANGTPTEQSLHDLLDSARDAGIGMIDTAPAYGESEIVLGRLGAGQSFDFITKTLASGNSPDVDFMVSQFHRSLSRLRKQKIYGLLFHNADILTSHAGTILFDAARQLKDVGRVEKLGVSVYNADQIDTLLAKYEIDLVQLPINLLDKRLVVSGALDRLKNRGVEVHARSAFLQGVLLSIPDELPQRVAKLRPYIERFRERLGELALSPLQACLGFLDSLESIDRIVVGITTTSELTEILLAMENLAPCDNFRDLAIDDPSLIDPRLWD